MALENRLDLRLTQSQKLVLTPQLQQAIKLLQLPQLELAQVLNQEMSENPFLEEIGKKQMRKQNPPKVLTRKSRFSAPPRKRVNCRSRVFSSLP